MAKRKADEGSSRHEALDRTLSQIEKQFGAGAIMPLGTKPGALVDGISTGSLALDLALGGAGMPRGRVVEVYGPEGSGKTALTLHLIANAQKKDGVAAFIDAENALDPAWARKLGVDIDNLLVTQPDTGEQALEVVDLLVRSNAVDVVVVDSVAALVPKAEINGEMGDTHVGLQARLMSQALRKLSGAISKSRCVVAFINQIREKIGVMYGSPETTPGGRALKFYASVRVDVRRVTSIKVGDEVVGHRVRATVKKNKVAPPFRRAEFDLMYDHGISLEGDIIDLGLADGSIAKSGAWFTYGDIKLGQGRERAKQFLAENTDLRDELVEKIRAGRGLAGGLAADDDGRAPLLDESQ